MNQIDDTLDPELHETDGWTGAALGPDELAELEEEREFLLRSLDDLDGEFAAGNLDDDEYHRLRDDYTARAAEVIRTIRSGVDNRPPVPRHSKGRHLLVISGIVAVILVAAVLLGRSLGERTRGQTITGNDQVVAAETATTLSPAEQQAAFADQQAQYEARIEASPDDVDAHLEYARFLLAAPADAGPTREHLLDAARRFGYVLDLQPDNVEAMAYGGWALALSLSADDAASDADNAQILEASLGLIDAAIATDDTYPDAFVFRGLVMVQLLADVEGARPYFERYLELAPDGEFATMVQEFVDRLPASTQPTAAPPSTPPAAAG